MNESAYLQAKCFIYNDIQREINLARKSEKFIGKLLLKLLIKHTGGANFMTALALLCYTEAAGRIINKNNNSANNFNTFFDELGIKYKNFRQSNPKTYDIFRCGLAHAYYVKKNCTIYMLKGKATCGIGIDKTNKYYFVVEKYFEDFKKAFESLLGTYIKTNSGGLTGIATTASIEKY